jgi:CelD/BcsL family acetyltransferase involved in cellulose biosynthesis
MKIIHYNDFEPLAPEWGGLLERATIAPFFMTPCYQRTWWEHLGQGDLHLLAARDDAGQLVGLAPLFGTTNEAGQYQLTLVGCVAVSDYLDIVADRAHVEAVHTALLGYLAGGDAPAWDKLYLCSLPHNSPTHTQFAEAAKRYGWQVTVRQQEVCPVIALPGTWDDYLAGISKKQRHEIRRKIRKLETEADARCYLVEGEAALSEAVESFIDLHQKSTQDKREFWDEGLVRFFRALMLELERAGHLKLYFLDINGTKAATMFCVDYHNQFLLYNSGFDPQFFNLSPGNVLTSYTIEAAIQLGRSRYDFLRGDEEYKFRFGAEAEPVYDLEIDRS